MTGNKRKGYPMTRLSVPDISCGHCKATVEKAIASVDPAASVDVDLASREVRLTSGAEVAALLAALKSAGYEATVTG